MTDLTLDHVALVTPSLEASKEDYESLGFTLTRESSHKGRVAPDGPVVPWGSGNHCAMFEQGYFEILGVTDPSRYHAHFDAALKRYHGVSLIALGCESASELYEEHHERVSGLLEPVEVGRDVPFGAGTREGLFRIVHLDDGVFPEAELFFIEHATPDVLWQESLSEHENRTRRLESITICSESPEETAARVERCCGLGGSAVDGRPFFELSRGTISISSPEDIGRRYPDAVLPAVPSVAVVTLGVDDVVETEGNPGGEGGDAARWKRRRLGPTRARRGRDPGVSRLAAG